MVVSTNKTNPVSDTQPSKIEELEFEGTEIKVGKRTFIMPPIPFTRLHKMGYFKLLKEFRDNPMTDPEEVANRTATLVDYIFVALQRNYPSITVEESVDLLTASQVGSLILNLQDLPAQLENLKNE